MTRRRPDRVPPDPSGQGASRLIEELREVAQTPAFLFRRFLGELQRITHDPTTATPLEIEQLRDLQAATVREIDENIGRFRAKVREAQARLAEGLRPSPAPLYAKIERSLQELRHLIDLAARREGLLRAWEEQGAQAIVAAYCAALDRGDLEAAEIYEAEAGPVLRRMGDAAALQTFLDVRDLAEAGRLTPAQRQAQADLEAIERLQEAVRLLTRVVASTLQVSGDLATLMAGWRRGGRLRLDAAEQASLRVVIPLPPHQEMTAHVLDVSLCGMHLALPEKLPPGARLACIVHHGGAPADGLRLQGEVRWCRADGHTPPRHLAGVRLGAQGREHWIALLNRLVERRQEACLGREPACASPSGASPPSDIRGAGSPHPTPPASGLDC